ncbi:DUF4433 domain-containing protein [Calothrix sp. NIES-3974]|uniref:DUF4433 domain-containing protein n=1 Tax=Calothrix sp. NIES-3974 TaxID=2005462 RepID=UPI000B60CAB2|nr:DUF4433 domain-containing protein [Calothrix sp. NIES-3974]BAZ06763.1 hypothetical protein NIES3974_34250 [Calothrix sp. NIES-3974]
MNQVILSHRKVEELGISYTAIYDSGVINRRKDKSTPEKSSLWDYANLYFQPRNPMMYRVMSEKNLDKKDIAVIGIKPGVLNLTGGFITDGNAANESIKIYPVQEGLEVLKQQWHIIQNDWWNELDGSKRKIMSECFLPEKIAPEFIHSIFVTNHYEVFTA